MVPGGVGEPDARAGGCGVDAVATRDLHGCVGLIPSEEERDGTIAPHAGDVSKGRTTGCIDDGGLECSFLLPVLPTYPSAHATIGTGRQSIAHRQVFGVGACTLLMVDGLAVLDGDGPRPFLSTAKIRSYGHYRSRSRVHPHKFRGEGIACRIEDRKFKAAAGVLKAEITQRARVSVVTGVTVRLSGTTADVCIARQTHPPPTLITDCAGVAVVTGVEIGNVLAAVGRVDALVGRAWIGIVAIFKARDFANAGRTQRDGAGVVVIACRPVGRESWNAFVGVEVTDSHFTEPQPFEDPFTFVAACTGWRRTVIGWFGDVWRWWRPFIGWTAQIQDDVPLAQSGVFAEVDVIRCGTACKHDRSASQDPPSADITHHWSTSYRTRGLGYNM